MILQLLHLNHIQSMKSKIDIYEIENKYKPIKIDMFSDYEEDVVMILLILNDINVITHIEKRIFTLYLETGSSRKAAEHCAIKYRRIAYIVRQVIDKINIELKKKKNYGIN